MLIEMPVFWIVILNVAGWPVIQLGLAWAFTRMPADWFHAPEARPFERGGRFYEEEFAIKRWKDRLPDAAGWYGGGFAKANLADKRPEYVGRFVSETWRGELCHWCALAFVPVFFLWNPWWADAVIVTYALAANLPCIFVQRHNRIRLRRVLMKTKGLAETKKAKG